MNSRVRFAVLDEVVSREFNRKCGFISLPLPDKKGYPNKKDDTRNTTAIPMASIEEPGRAADGAEYVEDEMGGPANTDTVRDEGTLIVDEPERSAYVDELEKAGAPVTADVKEGAGPTVIKLDRTTHLDALVELATLRPSVAPAELAVRALLIVAPSVLALVKPVPNTVPSWL